MQPAVALHTAGRRYCMDRFSFWTHAYSELQDRGYARTGDESDWTYTNKSYDTFPRYLVWRAILDEIERIDPTVTNGFDDFRNELIEAGWRASTPSTSNSGLPELARRAMTVERQTFASWVAAFPESSLDDIEPLPKHRVFVRAELRQAWDKVGEHWSAKPGHHWWPLRNGTAPEGLLAFHTDWFDREKTSAVREILLDHEIDEVWELREFGDWGCEQSTNIFAPVYNGEEGYWSSIRSDWLIYASHESSISLAGDWLVSMFRRRFPACDRYLYGGPFSTPDLRGTWDL